MNTYSDLLQSAAFCNYFHFYVLRDETKGLFVAYWRSNISLEHGLNQRYGSFIITRNHVMCMYFKIDKHVARHYSKFTSRL